MNSELLQAFFTLPSVRIFLDRAVEAFCAHSSLLILLPELIDPDDLQTVLERELWKVDISPTTINLKEMKSADDILGFLKKTFLPGVKPTPDQQISEIMDSYDFSEVMFLSGYEDLEQESQAALLEFMVAWAEASHQQANLGRRQTALCLVVKASQLKQIKTASDVYLQTLWWWGFPSALEMTLLCRQGMDGVSGPLSNRWREKLLPSLSAGDVRMCEHVWDAVTLDYASLERALKTYPLPVDWTDHEQQALQEVIFSRNGSQQVIPGNPPPVKLRGLWAKGFLYHTVEFGTELHPKVLACLGKTNLIQHRLWRAQTELLFPIIDRLRYTICEDLAAEMGEDWPYLEELPESQEERIAVQENPYSSQLGYLLHLLREKKIFRKFNRWMKALNLAYGLRNELAHYRAVDFRTSEELILAIP